MEFSFLKSVCFNASQTTASPLSQEQIDAHVDGALDKCRASLKDFSRFESAIEYLSTLLFFDPLKFPVELYLESLWATVKQAPYAQVWRDELKRKKETVTVQ